MRKSFLLYFHPSFHKFPQQSEHLPKVSWNLINCCYFLIFSVKARKILLSILENLNILYSGLLVKMSLFILVLWLLFQPVSLYKLMKNLDYLQITRIFLNSECFPNLIRDIPLYKNLFLPYHGILLLWQVQSQTIKRFPFRFLHCLMMIDLTRDHLHKLVHLHQKFVWRELPQFMTQIFQTRPLHLS